MKSVIAGIIDNILIFLVATFFSVAIAGYFTRDFRVIISAALTAAVCVTALTNILREKRRPLENPQIKETLTQFIYKDERFAFDFLLAALKKKYDADDKGKFILVNGTTAVFVRLKPKKISGADISYIYGEAREYAKKILILSVDGPDKDCLDIISALPAPQISVLDGEKTFGLLRWLDSIPETEIVLKRKKSSASEFFKACISPTRARRYFFTAFILLISSFFMPYSVYYIAFASVCIMLGILSKIDIASKFRKKKN